MTDSRYPYTYACDFIRRAGPVAQSGTVLSRSDASKIRQQIANALGMDDHELACKLADVEMVYMNDTEAQMKEAERLIAALRQ
jgi:carboxylesterase type B